MNYTEFLESKKPRVEAIGIKPHPVHKKLFDWQSDIVRWALKQGRAAIFADCGMGKTLMQVEWISQMWRYGRPEILMPRCLIVAPLSVAHQTIAEAKQIGVEIAYKTEPDDSGVIWITNYQRLHKFIGIDFDAIVLDESSILKSLDGKTRTLLLEQFTSIPYRLCCTATPSPNDETELTNHAEFLNVMSRKEMLATFFVHDSEESGDKGWRLKKHAREDYWRWVAQWAVYVRRPSDLGYPDDGFILPPLNIQEIVVESNFVQNGFLFPGMAKGIQGRIQARKHTLNMRVEKAVEIIKNSGSKEQWLVWCGLNDEGAQLAKALKSKALLIEGKTDDDSRITYESCWRSGKVQTLITKPGMFGFGLNWQHCHNVMYVGLSDSFEQWYQSIRRCWRFGQTKPVNVVVVTSDAEMAIVDNIKNKERKADDLAAGIVAAMKDYQIENLLGSIGNQKDEYKMKTIETDDYKLMLGDCVERIKEIKTGSVGLSIFSPPFSQLYTYSASERDMGNARDHQAFFEHFKFLIPELLRATMPGRRCCVHTQQIAQTLVKDGAIGLYDFRAEVVQAFVEDGWIYDGEIVIDKNPQAQAIRTKAKQLMFVQKNKDSSWSRPAMADYVLLFRAPGKNPEPIQHTAISGVTNEEWIKFAHPIWYDINESDTLNYRDARENADERHICPLQLETIRRCIRLWSNPGDLILSPFMGIGSEGYIAMEQQRRFVGIELKESYFKQAVKNISAAIKQESLFETVNA